MHRFFHSGFFGNNSWCCGFSCSWCASNYNNSSALHLFLSPQFWFCRSILCFIISCSRFKFYQFPFFIYGIVGYRLFVCLCYFTAHEHLSRGCRYHTLPAGWRRPTRRGQRPGQPRGSAGLRLHYWKIPWWSPPYNKEFAAGRIHTWNFVFYKLPTAAGVDLLVYPGAWGK